jgi:uncharacterized membrane protein YgcG
VEHGFPGGPPHPPVGPPLRGQPSDAAVGDPLGGVPPPDEAPRAVAAPSDDPPPLLLPTPPGAPAPIGVPDRPPPDHPAPLPGGAADPQGAAGTGSAAEEPVLGGVARDVPTFGSVLEAEREGSRGAVDRPPPSRTVPAAPAASRSGGLLASVRKGIKVTAYSVVGVFALLLVIGLLIGEETVDGAGEGAFAAVDASACRALVLADDDRFTAGGTATAEVTGSGLGDPVWEAPVRGEEGLLLPVAVAGDGGEQVTIAFTTARLDGSATTHAATYDATSGELLEQLHIEASLIASVPGTRWHLGAEGRTALLFPVVGTEIPSCFAAEAATGSPTPPLTYEVDGDLIPFASTAAETAVTSEGLLVVLPGRAEGSVQHLRVDGSVDDHVVEGADSVYADDEQVYLLTWHRDGQHLAAHDPATLTPRWERDLEDAPELYRPAAASDGEVLTMVSRYGARQLLRIDVADGRLHPAGGTRLDAAEVGTDGGSVYLVDPYPEGERTSRILALGPGDEDPAEIATPGLLAGATVGARSLDALLVSGPPAMGGTQAVVLRGGEVVAAAEAALLGLGAEHLIALVALRDGTHVLLGVPLGDPSGADDAEDDDRDAGDGEAGDDGADGEQDDGEQDDGGGGPGEDGGQDAAGQGDGGGGTGGGGARGSGGSGGGHEVTDEQDIDEGWLP